MNTRARWVAGFIVVAAGCRSYEPKPLDPQEILKDVLSQRWTAAPAGELSYADARALLRTHNPRVREAHAAYKTETAVAAVKTPLPNPSFGIGPTWVDSGSGVDAELGWSILLGGKRKITDELNAIRAERALAETVAVEREEVLALRREFLRLAAATHLRIARQDLVASAAEAHGLVVRLVEAAQATALDVKEAELEHLEAQADLIEAEEAEGEARSRLAARAGSLAESFVVTDLPARPSAVPGADELHELLMRDNPDLARLRARYLVAEKELHKEIAGQYPNLDIGAIFEREDGGTKWGLGIAITLPVFDRNQPAIARADAHRDEFRTRFEAQVARGVAGIDLARRRLAARQRRYTLVREKIRPAAQETLALMRKTMDAGAAGVLRLLAVHRQQRRRHVEMVEAEFAVFEAWADLESACGAPLLRFPEEGEEK